MTEIVIQEICIHVKNTGSEGSHFT